MSENNERYPSQFSNAEGEILILLILSDQNPPEAQFTITQDKEKQQTSINERAGTRECLTFLLKKFLKRLISHLNSCWLIFFSISSIANTCDSCTRKTNIQNEKYPKENNRLLKCEWEPRSAGKVYEPNNAIVNTPFPKPGLINVPC